MSIPNYQEAMLPVLLNLKNDNPVRISEIVRLICDALNLTQDERDRMLPSGASTIIHNRVNWAITYLLKAGLIERVKTGTYHITERGLKVLSSKPKLVDNSTLRQFKEFNDWINKSKNKKLNIGNETVPSIPISVDSEETPDELFNSSYKLYRSRLATEISDVIKLCSPQFFEKLVVELLVKMGYGGSMEDAGQAVGRSNDGGIDGIIKEDRLGLDVIYLQAKRWENSVSRPEIQKFAGALQGKRARKGVFITTSTYTKEAREFVSHIENKIILIDGDELAEFMIDHDVGVSIETTYVIKRIDSDYFVES